MSDNETAPDAWELRVYKKLPFPPPAGLECESCDGSGVSGDLYEVPGDTGGDGVTIVLLVDTLCRTCHAGRHPDHDPDFDPDADPEWTYDYDDHEDDDDDGQERAGTPCGTCGKTHRYDDDDLCLSCNGPHYNLVQSIPRGEPDDDEEPDDQLPVLMVMPCGCSTPFLVTVPDPAQEA